jgi:nucleotide-binding universal stress UspA family protein
MSVGGADLLTRIVEGAQKGLDDAIAPYADRNVEVSAAIDQEEPWRAILARAEAGRADLIVMGTHGRRGLPRALLGSVAEKVVRTAGCPVLTVRAEVTEP